MRKQSLIPLIFLLPTILHFMVFWAFPLILSFYFSFHKWSPLQPIGGGEFVGIQNYVSALQDDVFQISLKNTFIFAAGTQPVTMMIGLSLALLLKNAKGGSIARTLLFLPVITAPVAMGIVWSYLYNPTYGLFNDILKSLNLPPQGWLRRADTALFSVMVVNVWKFAGYHLILFLAGLQSIPEVLYDAAKIDGANTWSRFRNVTLPMLKPTLLFVVVMATIGALQVFDLVFVMTGVEIAGGPAYSTMVTVLYLYQKAFKYLSMGYASAVAIIFFIVILALSYIEMKFFRRGGMVYY